MIKLNKSQLKESLIFRSENRAIIALVKIQERFGGELFYKQYRQGGHKNRRYNSEIHFYTLLPPQNVFLKIGGEVVEYANAYCPELGIHQFSREIMLPFTMRNASEIKDFLLKIWDDVNHRSLKELHQYIYFDFTKGLFDIYKEALSYFINKNDFFSDVLFNYEMYLDAGDLDDHAISKARWFDRSQIYETIGFKVSGEQYELLKRIQKKFKSKQDFIVDVINSYEDYLEQGSLEQRHQE